MDTVGYFISDFVYMIQGKPGTDTSWFERLTFGMLVIGLVAYSSYTTYLVFHSYRNPDWELVVDMESKITFPSALFCPIKLDKNYNGKGITAHYLPYGFDTPNGRGLDCPTIVHKPPRGRNEHTICTLVNPYNNETFVATSSGKETISIVFPPEHNTPFGIDFVYAKDLNTRTEHLGAPDVIAATETLYEVGISKRVVNYFNGSSEILFTTGTSSTSNFKGYSNNNSNPYVNTRGTVIVTFRSFGVMTYQQYWAYDYMGALDNIGGALSLMGAVYAVVVAVYIGVRSCCEKGTCCCKYCPTCVRCKPSREDDDEGEEDEEQDIYRSRRGRRGGGRRGRSSGGGGGGDKGGGGEGGERESSEDLLLPDGENSFKMYSSRNGVPSLNHKIND